MQPLKLEKKSCSVTVTMQVQRAVQRKPAFVQERYLP